MMHARKSILMILISLPSVLSIHAQEKIDETAILMNTDRAFDTATVQGGAAAWAEYFAPNGSMISDTGAPILGKAAIRKVMEPILDVQKVSLRWQPTRAGILIPGNLGWTVGTFVRIWKTNEGKTLKLTGTYSTIWKKQPDGTWKAVLDTGEGDGAPVELQK
jgi:ketosteroid isomerase-like protein